MLKKYIYTFCIWNPLKFSFKMWWGKSQINVAEKNWNISVPSDTQTWASAQCLSKCTILKLIQMLWVMFFHLLVCWGPPPPKGGRSRPGPSPAACRGCDLSSDRLCAVPGPDTNKSWAHFSWNVCAAKPQWGSELFTTSLTKQTNDAIIPRLICYRGSIWKKKKKVSDKFRTQYLPKHFHLSTENINFKYT